MKRKKIPQKPFEMEMLPSTRKAQFFDLVKHRFFLLLALGAVGTLFSLPIILGAFFNDMAFLSLESGSEEEESGYSFMFELIGYGIKGLGFPVLFFGLAGILPIIKNLVWNEPIMMKEDFNQGLKDNGKTFLGLGFLCGIVYFLEGLIGLLFSKIPWFEAAIFAINLAFIFPLLLSSLFISLYYSNGFIGTIQKAASFYFAHFPLLFLSCLSLFAPLLFVYIPIFILKYALAIAWMVALFPLALLFALETHIYYFDKDINANQFPAYFEKGLAPYYLKQEEK